MISWHIYNKLFIHKIKHKNFKQIEDFVKSNDTKISLSCQSGHTFKIYFQILLLSLRSPGTDVFRIWLPLYLPLGTNVMCLFTYVWYGFTYVLDVNFRWLLLNIGYYRYVRSPKLNILFWNETNTTKKCHWTCCIIKKWPKEQ